MLNLRDRTCDTPSRRRPPPQNILTSISLVCKYCIFEGTIFGGGQYSYRIISTAQFCVFLYIFVIGEKSQVDGAWKIARQTPQSHYLKAADQKPQRDNQDKWSSHFKGFRDEAY